MESTSYDFLVRQLMRSDIQDQIIDLKIREFRRFLLTLPDEKRVAVLDELGFCYYCGDDTKVKGTCFCRADD